MAGLHGYKRVGRRAHQLRASRLRRQDRRIHHRITAAIISVSLMEFRWNELLPANFDIRKLGQVLCLNPIAVDLFLMSDWWIDRLSRTYAELRERILDEVQCEYGLREFNKREHAKRRPRNASGFLATTLRSLGNTNVA